MKELYPYSGPQDQYIMSLINLLKTNYTNVEVLRGKVHITFFYTIAKTNQKKNLVILREVIESSMIDKVVPLSLQELLTNNDHAVQSTF